jgi:hypothetical protein
MDSLGVYRMMQTQGLMPLGDMFPPSKESLLLVVTASYRMVSLGVYRMIQSNATWDIFPPSKESPLLVVTASYQLVSLWVIQTQGLI